MEWAGHRLSIESDVRWVAISVLNGYLSLPEAQSTDPFRLRHWWLLPLQGPSGSRQWPSHCSRLLNWADTNNRFRQWTQYLPACCARKLPGYRGEEVRLGWFQQDNGDGDLATRRQHKSRPAYQDIDADNALSATGGNSIFSQRRE